MGCFDTVRFRCPACFEAIEVQSKGGDCSCRTYREFNAPANVLGYIDGDTVRCESCNHTWKIKVKVEASLQYEEEEEYEE